MADLMDALDEAAGKVPAPPPVYANPRMDALAVAAGHPAFSDPRVPIQQRVENFSKMAVSSGLPWEEVAKAGQDQLGISPDQLAQHYNLAGARSQESGEEDLATAIGRRSVPFASAGIGVYHAEQYKDAKKRFDEGTATAEDTRTIARYEALQRKEGTQGTAESVVSGLAHIPAVLGEFGAGGKAARYIGGKLAPRVGGAVGRALGGEATGTAGQATQYAGRQLATTALAPSMYVPEAEQRSIEQGGEAYSGKNIVPAFAKGYAATLVLGSLQRLGSGGENLNRLGRAIQAVPTQAGRTAALTGVGMTEQAGVDTAGSIADTVLAPAWQVKTKAGGPVREWIEGKEGAKRDVIVQAATFGVFSWMHSGKAEGKAPGEAPRPEPGSPQDPATLTRAAVEGVEEDAKGGRSADDAAMKLYKTFGDYQALVADNPDTAWKTSRELFEKKKDSYSAGQLKALEAVVKAIEATKPKGSEPPEPSLAMLPPEGTVPQTETNANIGGTPPKGPLDGLSPDQLSEIAKGVGISVKQLKERQNEPWVRALTQQAYAPQNAPDAPKTAEPVRPEVSPTPEPVRPVSLTPGAEKRGRVRFPSEEEVGTAEMKALGHSQETIDQFKQKFKLFAPDTTTNFQQKTAYEATMRRAQEWVEDKKEPGTYVEMDISNLGGLNAFSKSNTKADKHFKAMADIVADEIHKLNADAHLFRQGGDEMGAIVVNADQAKVTAAMERAQTRIKEYAKEHGFHDIPHAKDRDNPARRGVGVYFGTADIKGGSDPTQIRDIADTQVAANKKKGMPHGERRKAEASGATPPEGQPGPPEGAGRTPESAGARAGAAAPAVETTPNPAPQAPVVPPTLADAPKKGPPVVPPPKEPFKGTAAARLAIAKAKAELSAGVGSEPRAGYSAGDVVPGEGEALAAQDEKPLIEGQIATGNELTDREAYVAEQRRLGRSFRAIAEDKKLYEKGKPISHQTVANIQKSAESKLDADHVEVDTDRFEKIMERSGVRTEEGRAATTHTDEGFHEVSSGTRGNLDRDAAAIDRKIKEYHDLASKKLDALMASGMTKEAASKRVVAELEGHAKQIEALAEKQQARNKEIIGEQSDSETRGGTGPRKPPPVRRGARKTDGSAEEVIPAAATDAGTPPGADATRPGATENGGAGQPAAASGPRPTTRRGAKSGNQLTKAAEAAEREGSIRNVVASQGGIKWDSVAAGYFDANNPGDAASQHKMSFKVFNKNSTLSLDQMAQALEGTGDIPPGTGPEGLAELIKTGGMSLHTDHEAISARDYAEWAKNQEDEHNARQESIRRSETAATSEETLRRGREAGEAQEAEREVGTPADETQGRADAAPEPDHAGADDFAFGANEPSANIGGSDPTRGTGPVGGRPVARDPRLAAEEAIADSLFKPPTEGGSIGAATPASTPTAPPNALQRLWAGIKERLVGVRNNWKELGGATAPRTTSMSKDAGLAMGKAASARIHAERGAQAVREHVLGPITGKEFMTPDEVAAFDRQSWAAQAKDKKHVELKLMETFGEERFRRAHEIAMNESRQASWARHVAQQAAEAASKAGEAATDPKAKSGYAIAEANALAEAKAQADLATERMNDAAEIRTFVNPENDRIPTEAEYQRVLASPEYKAFMDRWVKHVKPWMDQFYREAQGLLPDEEIESKTQLPGRPFNAKSMTADEVASLASGEGASRTFGRAGGEITNVRQGKLGFARKFTGSAEFYDMDPANVIQNSFARAAGVAKRTELNRTLTRDGLASPGKPGVGYEKDGVRYKEHHGALPEKGTDFSEKGQTSMYVHPHLTNEYKKALDLTESYSKIPGAQLATTLSVMSVVEAASHGKNLLGMLFRPGVNLLDLVHNFWGVIQGKPEVSDRLVQLSELGAVKPAGMESAGDKGHWRGGKLNPLNWISKAMDTLDLTMRLTADQAFDRLKGKWGDQIDSSEGARRDFINQLGQYNKRSQNDYVRMLRETGLGAFATAATGQTVQALRSQFLLPGIRANSWKAWAAMRVGMLTRIASVGVVGALANYLLWKRVDGDDSTPLGGVKVQGKDGRTGYLDLMALTGMPRGARTIGLLALLEGNRAGAGANQITPRAVKDVVQGLLHPAEGPAVSFVRGAVMGENSLGMPIAKTDPEENKNLANLRGALMNLNPIVGVVSGADRPNEKDAPASERAWRALGPFGVKFRSESSPAGGFKDQSVEDLHARVKTLETQKKQSVVKGEKWQSEGELKKLHHAAEQMAALDRQLRGETLRAGRIIPGPKPDSQTAEAIRKKQADLARQAMGR